MSFVAIEHQSVVSLIDAPSTFDDLVKSASTNFRVPVENVQFHMKGKDDFIIVTSMKSIEYLARIPTNQYQLGVDDQVIPHIKVIAKSSLKRKFVELPSSQDFRFSEDGDTAECVSCNAVLKAARISNLKRHKKENCPVSVRLYLKYF